MRIDKPSERNVAGRRDDHSVDQHAPALHVPAEPRRQELPQHVGDQINGPRVRDVDIVETEPLLQRHLQNRVGFANEIEAEVGKPGGGEQLRPIAAHQRRSGAQVKDLPVKFALPETSWSQKEGGSVP